MNEKNELWKKSHTLAETTLAHFHIKFLVNMLKFRNDFPILRKYRANFSNFFLKQNAAKFPDISREIDVGP